MISSEKEKLYYESLMELAESCGHSNDNPLSISLLCLSHNITFEQRGKIFVEFNKIIKENQFEDLSIQLFKNTMIKIVPQAESFDDKIIMGFIKGYAKNLIPELYPYSLTL